MQWSHAGILSYLGYLYVDTIISILKIHQLPIKPIEQAHISYQCRKATVLSFHRCLIYAGVEMMNNILLKIRALTTRCLYVRVNVGFQTTVHIF